MYCILGTLDDQSDYLSEEKLGATQMWESGERF